MAILDRKFNNYWSISGLNGLASELVAAMLSDDFRWLNGQRIEAAGGFML